MPGTLQLLKPELWQQNRRANGSLLSEQQITGGVLCPLKIQCEARPRNGANEEGMIGDTSSGIVHHAGVPGSNTIKR